MPAPNVLRKVKIEGKWKMLPVARVDGRHVWEKVMHRGQPIVATEGTFYLEYFAPKKTRRAVGTHPRDAKAALISQAAVLSLRSRGVETEDAPEIHSRRVIEGERIDKIVKAFIANPPIKLRKTSIAKYCEALESFRTWTDKTHISQLDRDDIENFMSHLVRNLKLESSTAKGKAVIVLSTMRNRGAKIKMKKGDWPQVTELQPEIYSAPTLTSLFAVMDDLERALFSTFLLTGFRDKEVGYLSWDDFKPKSSTLAVSKKVALGFDPKNYQERTIPIPQHLVKILLAHRETQPADEYLIFPTTRQQHKQGRPGGQRDRHMLDWLKRIAQRAQLNCGRCISTVRNQPTTCAKHPVCTHFTLHMFRHTYATNLLHDGLDLVSLQNLLGHKDIASTMKYLRMLVPADLLAKVNSSSLAKRFDPEK